MPAQRLGVRTRMQDDIVKPTPRLYQPQANPEPTGDILVLGAALIGAPTGDSLSRANLNPDEHLDTNTSTISLVREMAGLTPCALLKRAGINSRRRWSQVVSMSFALSVLGLCASSFLP